MVTIKFVSIKNTLREPLRVVLVLALSLLVAKGQSEDNGRVFGRVTSLSGYPQASAKVSFYGLSDNRNCATLTKLVRTVVADKSGNFEIAGIPYGHYRVEVDGTTEIQRFFLPKNGNEVLDIGIQMGFLDIIAQMRVSGTVADREGRPLAGATVVLASAYNTQISHQARTDTNGKYLLNSMQVGDYVLCSMKPGLSTDCTFFRLENGEKRVANLVLETVSPMDVFRVKIE